MPELDGFRGVAVLTVLGYHAFVVLGLRECRWLANGFLGVDFFFVLSGFLITSLLIGEHDRTGAIHLGRFYRRRAFRLLPALGALLVGHAIYAAWAGQPSALERETAVAVLFYYLNWRLVAGGRINPDLGHLWSLSIEEQFYVIWPLVIAGLLGLRAAVRRPNLIPGVLVVLIVGVNLLRIRLWATGTDPLALYVRTDTRADSLLVGSLLAWLWTRGRLPRHGSAMAAFIASGCLALVMVSPIRLRDPFFHLGGFALVALACALVILGVLNSRWLGNAVLRSGPLRAAGIVSYGLYLWHIPIFRAVARGTAHWRPQTRAALALGLTAGVTAVSWRLVERPCLRWKQRLEERSEGRVASRRERLGT